MITTGVMWKLLAIVALAACAIFSAWNHAERTRTEAVKSRQDAFTIPDNTAKSVRSVKDR